jgi:hypothetical protein
MSRCRRHCSHHGHRLRLCGELAGRDYPRSLASTKSTRCSRRDSLRDTSADPTHGRTCPPERISIRWSRHTGSHSRSQELGALVEALIRYGSS